MTINFGPGDTISVHLKITETETGAGAGKAKIGNRAKGAVAVKTRIQVFEGVVLYVDNNAKSFCVRKVSDGVGVERIFSFDTPWIEKIDIKKRAKKVRRAKLFYLRDLTPKQVGRVVA